jgi:hypothetical protein
MKRHPEPRSSHVWLAAVVVTSIPLLLALCRGMWATPYPISETVSLLQLAGVMEDAPAPSDSWIDPTLRSIFDPTARSWYRPLYHVTWYAFWQGTGSLDASLILFKVLEVGSVTLLVGLFLWRLRPQTFVDYAAASFATAVLVGMPGFRENLELPLPMTLIGMPLALIVWMLLEGERRAWHVPTIVALTLIAVGYKEQGLVILPVIVAAWWMGAPGASRATTLTTMAIGAAYLVFRFSTSGNWPPFAQDVGLGFAVIPANEASERFGAFPLWVYAYNAMSTVANILFSEPTAGVFSIVRGLAYGQSTPWQINHLLSSMALTGLVTWWGIGVWKRDADGAWSPESRVLVATVVAIAASGALGFNYSRDRLGGMAVVFYAIAAYLAARAGAERAMRASRGVMVAASLGLLLLAGGWHVRALGTVETVRVSAAKIHREWIADLQSRRTEFAREPGYLRILEAMVAQGTQPVPVPQTAYPGWATALLGAD